MIISKTQLDLIRISTDEILLNKYDYYIQLTPHINSSLVEYTGFIVGIV
jgi:hypothetical protein